MNIHIKNALTLFKYDNVDSVKKSDVYISGNSIVAIDKEPENFKASKVIDAENKLLIPGLINCHTHTYMSLFRNAADDLSFNDWLFNRVMPMEDKLQPEDNYYGALLACIEMIKTGTTCFLDMHLSRSQTVKAAYKAGMRGVFSRGLVGSDRTDKGGTDRLNEALAEMDDWKDTDRFSFALAPHAIYTCGTDYIQFICENADKYNLPIHIHISESVNELEECKKNHGTTPVEYLNNIGLFDRRVIAAHCVQLEGNDFDIFKEKNVNVVLNPISNLKLGNGFAPVKQMLDKGINLCMGTDSAASNNTLNLFSDMNFTALIHKGTNMDAQTVSSSDVLNFATINGAKALAVNTGKIECGKKADLVLLDLNCPQFNPANNYISALIYSANGSEVDTVIIDGEPVLENKKMCNVDEEEVYAKTNEIMKRIRA